MLVKRQEYASVLNELQTSVVAVVHRLTSSKLSNWQNRTLLPNGAGGVGMSSPHAALARATLLPLSPSAADVAVGQMQNAVRRYASALLMHMRAVLDLQGAPGGGGLSGASRETSSTSPFLARVNIPGFSIGGRDTPRSFPLVSPPGSARLTEDATSDDASGVAERDLGSRAGSATNNLDDLKGDERLTHGRPKGKARSHVRRYARTRTAAATEPVSLELGLTKNLDPSLEPDQEGEWDCRV